MGSFEVLPATFTALQVLREMGQPGVSAAPHQPFEQTVGISFAFMAAATCQAKPITLLGHVREGKESSEAHRASTTLFVFRSASRRDVEPGKADRQLLTHSQGSGGSPLADGQLSA